MYTYQCSIIRVIDGNTIDAIIDLGFNVTIRQRIKLYGANVLDVRSNNEQDRNKAIASKNRLTELLGNEFICETILNKRGKVVNITKPEIWEELLESYLNVVMFIVVFM